MPELNVLKDGRELGDTEDEINSTCLMTEIALERGNLEKACTLFRQVEKIAEKDDSPEIRAKISELKYKLDL